MEHVGTKALSDFEIKDADRGEVTAIVSTFNVVDRDGDVILPGAIKDGTVVKLSGYNHDVITKGEPPVGRGVIRVKGDRAVFEGRYFMSTPRGRDAFAQVKEMGTESEWSIGFPKNVATKPMSNEWSEKGARRLIAALSPIETSPVFIGANQYTETVGVKSHEPPEPDPAPEPSPDDATIQAIAKEVAERLALARKAAAADVADTARIEAETKAAEEARALQERKVAENAAVTREFEMFQRNMHRARAIA